MTTFTVHNNEATELSQAIDLFDVKSKYSQKANNQSHTDFVFDSITKKDKQTVYKIIDNIQSR